MHAHDAAGALLYHASRNKKQQYTTTRDISLHTNVQKKTQFFVFVTLKYVLI
jgi:hypothetical protein